MMNTRKPISPDEQMAMNEEPFEPKKFQTTMSGMQEAFKKELEEKQTKVVCSFQTTRSGMSERFNEHQKS